MLDRGNYLARRIRCNECEWLRGARNPPWPWPHCVQGGRDFELAEAPLSNEAVLCPAGLWTGLIPFDEARAALDSELRAIADVRKAWKPVLLRMISEAILKLGLSVVRAWIMAAIGQRECPLWLAVEVAKALGQKPASGVPAGVYTTVAHDGAAAIKADVSWGGNDPAYYALRDCVKAQCLTVAGATAIGQALAIVEPANV